jgi:hypothetical protein
MELSYENCPPPFFSFLRVWANTVPTIQSLIPEAQHDLARIICGLQPLLQNRRIAADLRAVAIEISRRRSFQDRYASDLQVALDAGSGLRPSTCIRLITIKCVFVTDHTYSSTFLRSSFIIYTTLCQCYFLLKFSLPFPFSLSLSLACHRIHPRNSLRISSRRARTSTLPPPTPQM